MASRRPHPNQTTLDELLRAHPDARSIRLTATGRPVVVLDGGGRGDTPATARRAA